MSAGPEALVWLVRHAEAGRRQEWAEGPDSDRPLSADGEKQAIQLLDTLRPHGVDAARLVLTSSYVRCRQTVEPLAAALRLTVEDAAALIEGAPLAATLRLIGESPWSVMSTHGDVVGNVVERLDQLGLVGRREPTWEKGSTWILRLVGAEITRGEYVPPPLFD